MMPSSPVSTIVPVPLLNKLPGAVATPNAATAASAATANGQLIALATNGDTQAQLELAYAYFDPVPGSIARYPEAFRWFTRAAAGGEPRAYLALGYMHSEGIGTARNMGLGRDFLEQALAADLPRAYTLLATIEQALPPSKRREEPIQLLRLGLQANDGPCGNALGVAYEAKGQPIEAERAYREAERLGSKAATQNIARLVLIRDRSNRSSMAKLSDRARLGDADAQYELAVRFHRGDGIPVNYGDAIRYYERAGAAGNAAAKRVMVLIASRPSATGDINVAWMQELASGLSVPGGDETRVTSHSPPVFDANPLVGLLAMRPRVEARVEPRMEPGGDEKPKELVQ
jgi:TPR repeat protein